MELSTQTKILTAAGTLTGVFITMLVLWLCLGKSKIFFILAGLSLAGILSISIWVLIQYSSHHWRRIHSLSSQPPDGTDLRLEYSFLRKVAGLPAKFQYEDLRIATNDFQALLGRGASASVFKGILDDGTQVAVKRIELGAEQANAEFRSEVSAIASVQHVNLARILGYCLVPNGTRFLVYDYVPNGSLAKWIFHRDKEDNSPCLSWPLRYKVAIEVAKALAYLHHDCRSRVLHLDIKPENILLDDGFRAVVSDFGLSKLMSRDKSRIVTTIRGTRGYLAPEWFLENGVSEKSDVYSYGMVLMEIVGGRRNVMVIGDERRWSYFPKVVAEKVREGKFMEVVDERVRDGVEEREVRALACVALWCAQEEPKLRPSMARVVDMLEGRMCVETPPETEMIMLDLLSMDTISKIPARFSQAPDPDPDVVGSVTCSFSFLSGR